MRRENFAAQVNSEILAAVRMLAQSEGRQLQALVDEALADLVEKRKNARPRAQSWPSTWAAMTNTATSTRSSLIGKSSF